MRSDFHQKLALYKSFTNLLTYKLTFPDHPVHCSSAKCDLRRSCYHRAWLPDCAKYSRLG